ncbi:MAG: VWA domain-containing protein [Vicinamibacterales bacterium]
MLAGCLLALSLGGAGVPAQAAVAGPTPVRLGVVVTDLGGRRVGTLGPKDFSVIEDGVGRLPVDSAEIAVGPRLFAIFLDDFHVGSGAAAERVREALARFVRHDLASTDQVVVLRPLDSLVDIRFAETRTAALAAIAAFEPRRGDYEARSDFERSFIPGDPVRVEAARARISTAGLRALISSLGQFAHARKTLIVISEGFADGLAPGGGEFAPSLVSVVEAANRANVAIYTVNPTAPVPASAGADAVTRDQAARRSFQALADDTGGVSAQSALEPLEALRDAVRDSAGSYVVIFTPSKADTGRLEPVTVVVSREGLTVRAQKAVGRRMPPPTPSVAVPSFLSTYSAQRPRRVSPLVRPWFGMSRGANGKTSVSMVWEPTERVPGDRAPIGRPSTVALTVTTLDGQPVFSGLVSAATTGGRLPSRVDFDAAPGPLLVEMSIQDLAARVIDRDVRDIVVTAFTGPVSLGTPEVFRTRTAREQQLIAANPHAPPSSSRQFSRAERLLVRLPVVSAETPLVSATFVSAFGTVMRELPTSPAPGLQGVYQFELPLASYAAGVYSLEIVVRTPAGSATEHLPIRITP